MQSLDILLGLAGGVAAMLWGVLTIISSGFYAFTLDKELMRSMYRTAPYVSERLLDSEDKAFAHVMNTVAERGTYFYTYGEYLTTWILNSWLCCRGCCCRSANCFQLR